MSHSIADKAREIVVPLAREMGLDVVEVEFAKERAEWYLRVFVDKRGGVRIDDCERLSKAFSTALDDIDIVDRAYSLVVSSPGLDRPLKTEADFLRHEGELLDVRMIPGRLVTSFKVETPATQPATKKTLTEAERMLANAKRLNHGADGADMISGFLDKVEGGRIYLADGRGGVFSLAWEDVKTAKRAIRFK